MVMSQGPCGEHVHQFEMFCNTTIRGLSHKAHNF